MTSYQPGEVLLVSFPLSGGGAPIKRPALVILDTQDADVLLARITTQPYTTLYDVAISDWSGAGLLAPSTVRLHKLATLEKNLIRRSLGALQIADRAAVANVLHKVYGTW